MALIINHNMPAMTAARNLGTLYSNLGKNIERLSSGLRINKAADDAAGLAVREMMRANIAATNQGIRNAADAVSLIQTADGAMAVIDAKLIRMKELAEQAATGTYTTAQREIINSEYQAMALEIDRIANATNFNGVKLLDGSMNSQNGGMGIRIHFGAGNAAAEDYYYVRTDDVRATSSTGLRVGGDGHNDIWSTGSYPGLGSDLAGCCGGGFTNPNQAVSTTSSQGFMYGYNWDGTQSEGSALLTGRYLAGRYLNPGGMSLSALAAAVNQGTQSRVEITITSVIGFSATAAGYAAICFGNDEVYYVGCSSTFTATPEATGRAAEKISGTLTAASLAAAINDSASSNYWALRDSANVFVFLKQGGDYNNLEVEESSTSNSAKASIYFTNVATGVRNDGGAKFSLGGEDWGTMQLVQNGNSYGVALLGRDIGNGMDLTIAGSQHSNLLSGINITSAANADKIMSLLNRSTFVEVQDAGEGTFLNGGAHLRTQEAAQQSLLAVDRAIERKDQIRANLGAIQNRLEATMENLSIQAENLQASESRISDVDVATEMTEFTKNTILAQAAASMLAQANSLSSLALTLIG
jgi:flagellin